MRLTKRILTSVCPVAILVTPIVLSIGPAFAQSTGTQEVETVVVTGLKLQLNGLMNAAPISKERSTITNDFLMEQISGQTVFQALNFMPGVNFTNNDPYGSSGGDIRMHGQDGNHISLTLDGMPLNDTGNYAIYTNQMIDAEDVDRISANQGSTDVDSPTAAATGGVVAIVTDKPHDDFGAEAVLTGGSFSDQRYFGRVDTGAFGPWDTKAFASFSYQDYDKYKGPGQERKIQGNFKILQDFGDLGWITLAGHWNSNRNNSYYGEDYVADTTGFTASLAGTADIIKNPNGGGYIANPLNTKASSFDGTGWDRDYQALCSYATPVSGHADSTMAGCGNWYKAKINPSDTGNVRMQSQRAVRAGQRRRPVLLQGEYRTADRRLVGRQRNHDDALRLHRRQGLRPQRRRRSSRHGRPLSAQHHQYAALGLQHIADLSVRRQQHRPGGLHAGLRPASPDRHHLVRRSGERPLRSVRGPEGSCARSVRRDGRAAALSRPQVQGDHEPGRFRL
jgi:hypothetical protein